MPPIYRLDLRISPFLEAEDYALPDAVLDGPNVFYGWGRHVGLVEKDVDEIFGIHGRLNLTEELRKGTCPNSEQILNFCKKTQLHPAHLIDLEGPAVSKALFEAMKHIAESPAFSAADREVALDVMEWESSRFDDLMMDDDFSIMYRRVERFFTDNLTDILDANELAGKGLKNAFVVQAADIGDAFTDLDLRLNAYEDDLDLKYTGHCKVTQKLEDDESVSTRTIQRLRKVLFDLGDFKPQEQKITNYRRSLQSGTESEKWTKTYEAVLQGKDPKLSGCYDFMARHRSTMLDDGRALSWPRTLEVFCDTYADLWTSQIALRQVKGRSDDFFETLEDFRNWRQRVEDKGDLALYRNALIADNVDFVRTRREVELAFTEEGGFEDEEIPDFLRLEGDES